MGVSAYLTQAYTTPEMLEALPELERDLVNSTPAWVTAAFAVAVWGGALGCLLLLLRKSIAHLILMISLLGIVVQMSWVFFVSNSVAVYGPGQSVMPIMVIAVGILLILLASKAKSRNWVS
ncbi:MAG: hypothetical protein RJQ00_05220 [Vicingaceae bacterium]